MAVVIRLSRVGKKKHPFYRIVVADKRAPRDGKFIDQVGYYEPTKNPPLVKLNGDEISKWIKKGAKPSLTVGHLIKKNMPKAD